MSDISLTPVAAQATSAPVTRAFELPIVQVWRGVAALSIAFLHVSQQAGVFVGRPGEPAYDWLRPLPWEASVDLFFVISGFVMVWSSTRLFGRPGAVHKFLGRRVARVVPLYWAMTSVVIVIALLRPGSISEQLDSVRAIVGSYLFIPYQRPDGFIQPVFRLGWTLNYEVMFYALFTLAIRFPARIAVPGLIATIVAMAAAGRAFPPASPALAFWTDPIVLDFVFGMLLAILAISGARLKAVPCLLLLFAAPALLLASDHLDGVPRVLAYGGPCTMLVAVAVLGPVRSVRSPALRFGVLVGDASYSLYLVHPFPMRALEIVWLRLGLTGVAWNLVYIASVLGISIVAALALHRWFELPATAATRRLLQA